MRIRKTLHTSDDSQRASDSLIVVVSAEVVTILKSEATSALAVSPGSAKTGVPSNDMFVAHLDDKLDGSFSVKPH